MTNAHYPKKLLKDYELLLSHFPSHSICRPFVVEAIESWKNKTGYTGNINILEIGPGYGETTELILHNKNIASAITFTLVESDANASSMLMSKLKDFESQITSINEDATEWIKSQPANTYDVFTASWVVHNFPSDQRERFLTEVARVLKSGGLFIIFDKILPDSEEEIDRLWNIHAERLSALDNLGRSDLKNEMLTHEMRDAAEPYVWYESDLYKLLKELNFKGVKIVMRNERDVVALGIKQD